MLENRKYFIYGFFILTGLVYLARLFYLQVLDSTYETATNSIRKTIDIPFRGLIYDRNGKQIVYNTPSYSIYVTPNKTKIADTTAFCNLLAISRPTFDSLMNKARTYSKVKSSLFLGDLTKEEFAQIQDAMVDYDGFEYQKSAVRSYNTKSMAHALGYVSEISEKQLERQEDPYYRQGDLIGQTGLERFYEEQLRGQRGVRYVMQDVKGVAKGSWKDGKMDTIAVAGQNLYTSVEQSLQELVDSLMQQKAGAVVAIEPSTGQILAISSAPSFDPALLSSRNFSKNYGRLINDPYKIMLDKSISSYYRPGSTFKTVQALAAMQDGAIGPGTAFGHAGVKMKCHNHPLAGSVHSAIQWSCNPYFYQVFRKMIYNNGEKNVFKSSQIGLDRWAEYMNRFGFKGRLGIDLFNEAKGTLPDAAYFDKIRGKNQWRFGQFASMGIGEGEIQITPLKIANLTATIANRGWYITPHLVTGIGKQGEVLPQFQEKHETKINKAYFEEVINGMEMAVIHGTFDRSAIIPGVQMCGKTGTSQTKNPKHPHSIFMAFAPKYNPKIAVAVFLEDAGYGGFHAGPIASLVIEKYLKGEIQRKAFAQKWIAKNYLQFVPIRGGQKPVIKKQVKSDSVKKDSSKIIAGRRLAQ
jgi:penicillin-binding protein 2